MGPERNREIVAHDVITDRACKRQLLGDEVRVQVERVAEIVLARTASELFSAEEVPAFPLPQIRFLDAEAMALGEQRKFWLVNGTHTALGLLCAAYNLPLLADGLADPRVRQLISFLHQEWVYVLHAEAAAKGLAAGILAEQALLEHAERMFERLMDVPDWSVRDVLRELTDMTDRDRVASALQRLLQKLDDRLAQAVRSAAEGGTAVQAPASGFILATGVATVRRHADTYLL